jgi:UPF0716 protein FxsA
MPFLILFILLPIMEIWAFIQVGDEVGFLGTIGLCFLTAIVGVAIAKIQGIFTLDSIRQSLRQGNMPLPEIMDGFLLMVAAICLIIPGFITDTVGFLLLLPPMRNVIKERYGHAFVAKTNMRGQYNETHTVIDADVIEGDYERVDDNKP